MYSASSGLAVATQSASTVLYSLTDHNRKPLSLGFDFVEKSARMADGTMRKYVVAKKRTLSVSWDELPSATYAPTTSSYVAYTMTVDGYPGGAWIKSFYEANVFKPVYVRVVHSQDDYTKNSASAFKPSAASGAVEYFWAFMTNWSYEVTKRYNLTDIVNVSLGFTEI